MATQRLEERIPRPPRVKRIDALKSHLLGLRGCAEAALDTVHQTASDLFGSTGGFAIKP